MPYLVPGLWGGYWPLKVFGIFKNFKNFKYSSCLICWGVWAFLILEAFTAWSFFIIKLFLPFVGCHFFPSGVLRHWKLTRSGWEDLKKLLQSHDPLYITVKEHVLLSYAFNFSVSQNISTILPFWTISSALSPSTTFASSAMEMVCKKNMSKANAVNRVFIVPSFRWLSGC